MTRNSLFLFLFHIMGSVGDTWWIIRLFTKVLLSVEKASHNNSQDVVVVLIWQTKAIHLSFSLSIELLNTHVRIRTKQKTIWITTLTRHLGRSFISLMSSYFKLQQRTVLTALPSLQIVSWSHRRQWKYKETIALNLLIRSIICLNSLVQI